MKTITKTQQKLLQKQYEYWHMQNINPAESFKFALQDMGLPPDFCISDYTIVDDIERN